MVGDAFIQGLRYRLPLPKVCRPFGAYNPHNLIPNSRSHITCLIVPLAFWFVWTMPLLGSVSEK